MKILIFDFITGVKNLSVCRKYLNKSLSLSLYFSWLKFFSFLDSGSKLIWLSHITYIRYTYVRFVEDRSFVSPSLYSHQNKSPWELGENF